MNIWRSRQREFAIGCIRAPIVSRFARIRRQPGDVNLIHRRVRPAAPPPPRETKIIRNTVHQTVVHIHQTVLNQSRITTVRHLRRDAFLLLLPQIQPRPREPDYLSRPTRSAKMLVRIFSRESARRELRTFYSDVVRGVLKEEQERYRSRPTKAISLIWNLFGRPHAFQTLTRFYLSAVERLGSSSFPALNSPNALYPATGVLTHSRLYRRYVYQIWSRSGIVPRYAVHTDSTAEDLVQLPVARRGLLPSRQAVERLIQESGSGQARQAEAPVSEQEPRLSEREFRALVRGVTAALSRQSRLESLQQGGY